MKLKEIIDFLDEKVPNELALDFDNVGLMGEYDLNTDINYIRIFMDLWSEFDEFKENTLIITHHPPLFEPETPTYTIHSNWDIIDGGANEALAKYLKLEVVDYFDEKTKIGRICKSRYDFNELKDIILDNFKNVRIVNEPDGKSLEGVDVLNSVTGLSQQSLVGDDAVGLDHVSNAVNSVAVLQSEAVVGQVAVDVGAGQIVAVILPVSQTHGAVDLEQSGSLGLAHLSHQSFFVGAGSSGENGDGNTGLGGVGLGQLLPGLILLGLEVQVVDGTGSSFLSGSFGSGGFRCSSLGSGLL